jgi:hypothetical protein
MIRDVQEKPAAPIEPEEPKIEIVAPETESAKLFRTAAAD